MIITFNSLLVGLHIFVALGLALFFCLEHIPLSHFACLFVFVYMYWLKLLPPSILNERPCVRAAPCGPEVQSPLATRGRHFMVVPYVSWVCLSL